ncbi:MAG TPA: hypothetical protein VG347_05445 [Verrucomicrobiae bacterium]|nr:hypothetical protein [Verrucomicrobiae bacterium]
MAKTASSLKTKNAAYFWTFITANLAVFWAVMVLSKCDYDAVNQLWHKITKKDGLLAVTMPLLAIVLNGFLDDQTKARLVFWRWKNPLPGCRAFSNLIRDDPRINVEKLKLKLGAFPRSPRDQNVLWYQIYKKNIKSVIVSDSHRIYLLTRDMAALSAVFIPALSTCTLLSACSLSLRTLYCVALFFQYFIVATSARNYGNRFVANVLAEESHLK